VSNIRYTEPFFDEDGEPLPFNNRPIPNMRVSVRRDTAGQLTDNEARQLDANMGRIQQAYNGYVQNGFLGAGQFRGHGKRLSDDIRIRMTTSAGQDIIDVEIDLRAREGQPTEEQQKEFIKVNSPAYYIAAFTESGGVAVYKFASIDIVAQLQWQAPAPNNFCGYEVSTKGSYICGYTNAGDIFATVISSAGIVSSSTSPSVIASVSEVSTGIGFTYVPFEIFTANGFDIYSLPGGAITQNNQVESVINMASVSRDGTVYWGTGAGFTDVGTLEVAIANAFFIENGQITYLLDSATQIEPEQTYESSFVYRADATGRYALAIRYAGNSPESNSRFGIWDRGDLSFIPLINSFPALQTGFAIFSPGAGDIASDGTTFLPIDSGGLFDRSDEWIIVGAGTRGTFPIVVSMISSATGTSTGSEYFENQSRVSDDGNMFLLRKADTAEWYVYDRRTTRIVSLITLCPGAVAGIDITADTSDLNAITLEIPIR